MIAIDNMKTVFRLYFSDSHNLLINFYEKSKKQIRDFPIVK
jgi:hypothetical protein